MTEQIALMIVLPIALCLNVAALWLWYRVRVLDEVCKLLARDVALLGGGMEPELEESRRWVPTPFGPGPVKTEAV